MENRVGIVETIFAGTHPSEDSGSLWEILEARSKAFVEHLDHHSPKVREIAKAKLTLIEKSIREEREQEAKDKW